MNIYSEDKFYIQNYNFNELSNFFDENKYILPPNPYPTEDNEKNENLKIMIN